ncbi:hypothetical protein FD04_GL002449 [Secundilactobacillus odoratitofui DSM 19909 = JCM 15043]|uniref:Lipoprotein n=1 Tax=Secundilactobacillus odoratitofui DSM 19909 = JCM 15043 TaxID=1423776 RepID=A0A0R1M3Z7_9LACO|nr:hypothetical protein [Secundilactobacillus odoratitofui]KRK99673.1 hypothetical protein FD04_GL002449 [Secundilactobacillus odoratitofui DSM 19909 = JCM 15043]
MKKTRTKALLLSLVAVLAIFLTACGSKSSTKSNEQASFKNEPTTTKHADVKSSVLSGDGFWYLAGKINHKSNSGIEAIAFNKNTGKATMYNVNKFYKTYSAAKKANALNKEGTVKYTFTKNSKNQTVIKLSGKLSGIDMTQTVTVKNTTKGTNKATKLHMSGYQAVRDVDMDKTNAVFVEAN